MMDQEAVRSRIIAYFKESPAFGTLEQLADELSAFIFEEQSE